MTALVMLILALSPAQPPPPQPGCTGNVRTAACFNFDLNWMCASKESWATLRASRETMVEKLKLLPEIKAELKIAHRQLEVRRLALAELHDNNGVLLIRISVLEKRPRGYSGWQVAFISAGAAVVVGAVVGVAVWLTR